MPRRPALVTQADIARAVRALKAAGVEGVRVAFRRDGVFVEGGQSKHDGPDVEQGAGDPNRIVVL